MITSVNVANHKLPPAGIVFSGISESPLPVGMGKPDGQCILIIEDNPGDVFIIEEALREHNVQCQLTVLSDGEEAASLFDRIDNDAHATCPSLVLLDLNLPRRSGHWVLNRIRSSRRCRMVPVVIVSSSEAPVDIDESNRLGATAYFKKWTNLPDFLKLGALVHALLVTG